MVTPNLRSTAAVCCALLVASVGATSDTLMCVNTHPNGNLGTLHHLEPSFAIAPCSSGLTQVVGPLDSLVVIRRKLHQDEGKDADSIWQAGVSNATSALKVQFHTYGIAVAQLTKDGDHQRRNLLALLPPRTQVVSVAQQPISTVDMEMQKKLANVRSTLAKDPVIEQAISFVDGTTQESYLDYLTGVTSDITSRNSVHPDGLKAAKYIASEFEKYGFTTTLEDFMDGYNPNVVAKLRGVVDPDLNVVIGAHYDSRGPQRTSPTAVAPGANDDGSGTSALLQVAKIIHAQRLKFKYTLIIVAFSGEEQGLYGSKAYAQKLKAENARVLAMLQSDMTAYRVPTERIQLGLPDRISSPMLNDLIRETVEIYTNEVEVCYTPVCCSDHQSFYQEGYSASQFFERCSSIADPEYHSTNDIVRRPGFDIPGQLRSLTKAMFATTLVLLEPVE